MEAQEIKQIIQNWNEAATRLIIINPSCLEKTEETSGNINDPEVIKFFSALTSDQGNDVIILGEGTREQLDQLSGFAATLVAENGGFSKDANGEWQPFITESMHWKEPVRKALRTLVTQYAGSFLEEKYFSMAWHFDSDAGIISTEDRRQLLTGLRSLAKQFELVFRELNGSIDFSTPAIGREKFITDWMTRHGHYDLIIAIGNNADEGLFQLLEGFVTICVNSRGPTGARYEIGNSSDIVPTLSSIAFGSQARNNKSN